MGRRKKGQKIHGWVVVDKPAGLTSTQVVGRVRRAFDAKKAGHSGTLDPAATGILAIALGEATKTIPFVTDADKGYEFTVRWGASTSTDDAEGEVIATKEDRPSTDDIIAALPDFTGDIQQTPPQVSAVKVDGERAYDLAREGEEFELKSRPLHVSRLDLTGQPDADTAIFRMDCGKGGYVRSIARDLGQRLGCLGHVQSLRRLWSGPFAEEDAASLEDVEADPQAYLRPLEVALADLPRVHCSSLAATRLKNGNPAEVIASEAEFGDTAWAVVEGAPVAIGVYRAGMLHPNRVFQL